MYRCWLFGVFLMCKAIAVVNTAAIDRWELRFALHQTLETALISPLNLFKLSEVFFPRRHDIIISPVSVQVTYNLTCQEPTNCSLQTENDSFCGDGGYIASYFWTSLPIHRTDPYTFSILESFSQRHFGRTVPLVELSLEVKSLPCSISEQDVRDELLCISAMLKAYAKEQGVPSPKSDNNLKGFVDTLPRIHITSPSFDTFRNISNVLVHCSILFTSLSTSYHIYKAVYKNGKKKPVIYGAYWATVLFLTDLFIVTVTYNEKDALKDPVLVAFLVVEGFFSIVMTFTFTCFFAFTKEDLVFPIPIIGLQSCKGRCKKGYIVFAGMVQAVAMWFTVAGFHAFVANITVHRVEVFLTSPLETFIEFVFYLLLAICFFVVLNLPFYIGCGAPIICCTPCEMCDEFCNIICCTPCEICNRCCNIICCTPCEICNRCCNIICCTPCEMCNCCCNIICCTPCEICNHCCNDIILSLLGTVHGFHKYCHPIWKMVETCANLLNIGVLLALIFIAGFSNRYIALTLSQSQDSDARLLIAVLPTVAVTAVVALKWPYIKKIARKLVPKKTQSNPKTDAENC